MTTTRKDLKQLIDMEAEESEKHRDEPMVDGKRRPGTRKQVYSIRLAPEQIEQIEQIATDAGVPASGLVREWVLHALAAEQSGGATVASVVQRLSNDVAELRRVVNA